MTDLRVVKGPSGQMDCVESENKAVWFQCQGPKTANMVVSAIQACHLMIAAERGEAGFYAAVAKAKEAVGEPAKRNPVASAE